MRRSNRLLIRVSPEELAAVRAGAATLGVGLSEFARRRTMAPAALAGPPDDSPPRDARAIERDLVRWLDGEIRAGRVDAIPATKIRLLLSLAEKVGSPAGVDKLEELRRRRALGGPPPADGPDDFERWRERHKDALGA